MDIIFLTSLGIDQYVIQEYNEKPINVHVEYSIHQIHKHKLCISVPKGYYRELIILIACMKRNLANVIPMNIELIVSQIKIYLQEHSCSLHLGKQVIYHQKMVLILHHHLI